MAAKARQDRRAYLRSRERWAAGIAGALLLAAAAWAVADPPVRVVALAGCTPDRVVTCTVSVDGDLATFAGALAALGVAAILVAVLGIRFSKVSAGGVTVESNFDDATAGMTQVSAPKAGVPGAPDRAPTTTSLNVPEDADSSDKEQLSFQHLKSAELNRIRNGVYDSQRGVFMAHLLGEPKISGQAYRVAIFVVGHRRPITQETVEGATIFLGEAWGSRKFEAAWSNDGRLGVIVEAFGPFLAIGEVRLITGERVRVRHYVEFAQGELLG